MLGPIMEKERLSWALNGPIKSFYCGIYVIGAPLIGPHLYECGSVAASYEDRIFL